MKRRKKGMPAEMHDLGSIMGSGTGASEHSTVSGGWAGTDDATSTAPSDQIGNPPIPEEDKSIWDIERDFDESVKRDEAAQSWEPRMTAD